MSYICSVLASQVQPKDLRLAATECDGGKIEYQLIIEGSYLTIFTPDCSLESFAALGRRILYLAQKEQAVHTDPDQAVTPTVPQPSQPAEDVTPDLGDPVAAVTESDKAAGG